MTDREVDGLGFIVCLSILSVFLLGIAAILSGNIGNRWPWLFVFPLIIGTGYVCGTWVGRRICKRHDYALIEDRKRVKRALSYKQP